MADLTCFTRDELREYLLGELPDGELNRVAAHLEACAACEATVSQLDPDSDTLIESLRSPVQPDNLGSAYRLAALMLSLGSLVLVVGGESDLLPWRARDLLRDY